MKELGVDAEDAVFAINFLKSLRLRDKPPRRRPYSYGAAHSRLQTEMQIGRLVAIIENYLFIGAVRAKKPLLLQPVPPSKVPDPTTVRLQNARLDFFSLVALWRKDLGVDLKLFPKWSELDTLRYLRHVLVHRLGIWQPALDPQPKLKGRVAKITANPDLYRGPIPIEPGDFDNGIILGLGLISYVEANTK